MFEDDVLNRVSVDHVLRRLDEADAVMMRMVFRIEYPDDYAGGVPATFGDIGSYIGLRFEGAPLSEAAIRYRRDVALGVLRGERDPLRRVAEQIAPLTSNIRKNARKSPNPADDSWSLRRNHRGVMTNEQFEKDYYPRYEGVINALARKLARRDSDLFEDLRAVGMMSLWELDPSKATTNEDAWIRQALFNKMTDVLRRDRPGVYESLQAHLGRGEQLVEDPSTGERRLIQGGQPVRGLTSDAQDGDDDEEG